MASRPSPKPTGVLEFTVSRRNRDDVLCLLRVGGPVPDPAAGVPAGRRGPFAGARRRRLDDPGPAWLVAAVGSSPTGRGDCRGGGSGRLALDPAAKKSSPGISAGQSVTAEARPGGRGPGRVEPAGA